MKCSRFTSHIFLFKSTNWWICSPFRQDLLSLLFYPAAENSHSDGVDMAGIANNPLPSSKELGIDRCSSSTNSRDFPYCQCRDHSSTKLIMFIFVMLRSQLMTSLFFFFSSTSNLSHKLSFQLNQ